MTTFTPAEKKEIQMALKTNSDVGQDLYIKLFDHFNNNGEMPYGTAKARTGDPFEWVHAHMEEVL